MESLQDWGLLGEIYIGCGFIRGKLTGIHYDILGRVGGRLAATGEKKLGMVCISNPSVSLAADSSPYTGELWAAGT